jgi:putative lipoic acid-binding regulatory protein
MTDDEDRLRELLQSQHSFPGPYAFKVILRNAPGAQESIIAGIRERTGLSVEPAEAGMRASRKGNYVSLNLKMRANLAQDVLDVYACLRTFDSVIQYF